MNPVDDDMGQLVPQQLFYGGAANSSNLYAQQQNQIKTGGSRFLALEDLNSEV